MRFAVLVGLRPSEVVESARLVMNSYTTYYNPERQALEHFRFPKIFLRQTKKAYISFVTPSMIDIVKTSLGIPNDVPSYQDIRYACWSTGIKCDMRFCRKIFASHLRNEGIQPEVVDMLQGRVSPSILTRYYLVPQSSLKDQVLQALEKLNMMIVKAG